MRRIYLLLLVGLLAILANSNTAEAQARSPRRVPNFNRRPILSPYINLFQSNNGGMNSYFAFVQPQQQAIQFMQDTRRREAYLALESQNQTYEFERSLETTLEDSPLLKLRRSPNSSARHMPGSFMNYSRYYPLSQQTGVVPRR